MVRIIKSIQKRLARRKSFPSLGGIDGATFVLDPKNWIDNRILAKAAFEQKQIEFARKALADKKIQYVVDVGANFGLYTVLLGMLKDVKEVHSFEPVRRNFNQLCGNVFSNRIDSKVITHNLALGAVEEERLIYIDKHSTGVSRIDLSTTSRNTEVFSESEMIRVALGDKFLKYRGVKVFVKIDVEGFALNVLRGMPMFLFENYGVIQLEVDRDIQECSSVLETFGWRNFNTIDGDSYFEKCI